MPKSSAWRTVAARISKNLSRLVQEMHRYLSRSSKGMDGSCACASKARARDLARRLGPVLLATGAATMAEVEQAYGAGALCGAVAGGAIAWLLTRSRPT